MVGSDVASELIVISVGFVTSGVVVSTCGATQQPTKMAYKRKGVFGGKSDGNYSSERRAVVEARDMMELRERGEAIVFLWGRYGRNKNTILLDAFNSLLHSIIIPHGKRMIRERMKFGKLYAFNHFGCVVRFHTTSLFRFHIWNRRGKTSAASPICKWCTLFVLNAPCAWEINKRLVATKLIGISPLPGSPPAP